jgi:hypothetical protein
MQTCCRQITVFRFLTGVGRAASRGRGANLAKLSANRANGETRIAQHARGQGETSQTEVGSSDPLSVANAMRDGASCHDAWIRAPRSSPRIALICYAFVKIFLLLCPRSFRTPRRWIPWDSERIRFGGQRLTFLGNLRGESERATGQGLGRATKQYKEDGYRGLTRHDKTLPRFRDQYGIKTDCSAPHGAEDPTDQPPRVPLPQRPRDQ